MKTGYVLTVKNPIQLMENILDLFSGNARLSLEGDLSQCNLGKIPLLSDEPLGKLTRHTLSPADFFVLPVESHTKELIKRQILPTVGLRSRVFHILLEKDGELVFAAYDCFGEEGVWVSGTIPEGVLSSLVSAKIIQKYTTANA